MRTIVPSVIKHIIALVLLVLATIAILIIGSTVISVTVIPLLILAYFVFIHTLSCPTCSREIKSLETTPFFIWQAAPIGWLFYIPFRCPHCGEDLKKAVFKE